MNLEEAGQSDKVIDTVHYGEVFEDVKAIVEGPPCNLIEHLAERIAKRINSHYNRGKRKSESLKKIHLFQVTIMV